MNTEPAIIAELLGHEDFTFSLVGSRRLGINDDDSDWDFVVTWSKDVVKALYALGFTAMSTNGPSEGYDSSYVVCVMQKVTDGAKVQVSCEKNAMWKNLIMRAMEKSPELAAFDRSLRGDPGARDTLWEALYELAGFTETEELEYEDSQAGAPPMSDDDIPF